MIRGSVRALSDKKPSPTTEAFAVIRGSRWAVLAATLLAAACGPAATAKCQSSNCSGCCADDTTCLGSTKQSFNACGSGGNKCRTCLPQQTCSALRCVDGSGGGGGDGGGTGTGGGSGGGAGGGTACGSTGQACCIGSGSGCLLGLFCVNNVCSTTSGAGGGGATGGGAGGGGGSGGGGSAGGSGGGGTAGGGGAGGGAALGALGAPCVVNNNCTSNYCQAIGFQDGYCTVTCISQADCPSGSKCSRNPGGGGGNVCLNSCPTAGVAPGGCRTGYVCEKFQSSMDGTPVCFPKCSSANNCVGGPLVCDGRGFCCGVNGAACCDNSTCDSPNTCDPATKHCKSLPPTGRAPGEPCTMPGNCAGNTCVAELSNTTTCAPVCFSGGYCTQNCDAGVCPSGSSCSPYTFSTTGKWCVSDCVWDGGQGDCRTNYVCDRYLLAGTSTQSTCFKKCFADAGCATNTACDNGFCCGKPYYRCCSGAVKCPGGGSGCNALNYCDP